MLSGYGVVLGGGGAKGGYEIGVWKALRELDVPICAVAGTSVGTLNGAIMVQGDFETAEKLWTSLSIEKVINFQEVIEKAYEDKRRTASLIKMLKSIIISRGFDISPLRQTLEEVIDEKMIRESKIEFGIVTFSLSDFKPIKLFKEDIPEGKIVDYLLASACFPLFKRQTIDNKKYIDGGVYDNIPVSLMVQKGIKDIIVVDISGVGITRRIDHKGLNIKYIKNSRNLGGTLKFDAERSKANIEMGYYDTLRAFHKLDGKKYYIMPKDDRWNNKLLYENLKIEHFKTVYDFLGLEWGAKASSADKLILYRIMKTLRKYSNGKLSINTVIPAMAEIAAEQLNIDRSQVYTMEQFINMINSQYSIIKGDKDFNDYMKSIRELVALGSPSELSKRVKEILTGAKFLLYYNPNINESDKMVKMFRRFMALAFTKICIANIFISFVLSKNEENISADA